MLTQEAKIAFLNEIIEGAKTLDENTEEPEAIDFILFHVIDQLDEADSDDCFGTEGWRHSILGED